MSVVEKNKKRVEDEELSSKKDGEGAEDWVGDHKNVLSLVSRDSMKGKESRNHKCHIPRI